MYQRTLLPRLASSPRSVLLLGPRQVGKSTLLGSLEPDLTINLARPDVFRSYTARPEQLEAELRAASPQIRTVMIDEAQRVPALLDVVQVILDEQPDRFRFLLCGSSARKLRRGQANLLPGRVHLHHLHPLTAVELGAEHDLDRVMAHGSLPGIYAEPDPELRAADLRAYTDAYLKEEIQAESLVRNLGGYARLLELVAASSGRIINLNALCRDAAVSYATARRYIQILQDTLIAFGVEAWSQTDRVRLVAHPKVFLFDLGVRNALLHRPLDRPLNDERGLLFEHVVTYEIQRRLGTLWPEAALYHYRTRHGLEVDLILQIGDEQWGIEIKSGQTVPPRSLRALAALADRLPNLRRRLVVFNGARRQILGTVEVLPFEDFLSLLPA